MDNPFGLSGLRLGESFMDGIFRPGQAWAIEDLEQDVGLLYRQMGRKGLENIQNVGPRLAEVVEDLLHAWSDGPSMVQHRSI